MKGPSISLVETLEGDGSFEGFLFLRDSRLGDVKVQFSREELERQLKEPINLKNCHLMRVGVDDEFADRHSSLLRNYWIFRNRILEVMYGHNLSPSELLIHIKHWVLKKEGELDRMRRTIEAFENLEKLPSARREKIPEKVRLFVWQRDDGKCSECGSRESLEFDHIIPLADGGSNTERNIQLLCERCNRKKGKSVC